jgi:hypothetical protein
MSSLLNVPNDLPSAISTGRGKRAAEGQGWLVSPVLFSPHVNDRPAPFRNAPQSIASCRLSGDWDWKLRILEHWLRDSKIAISLEEHYCALCWDCETQSPDTSSLSNSEYNWSKQHGISGVSLDTQLTCSAHVSQVGKKEAQGLGVLGPLLNRRSGISVRNSVLLYKKHVPSGGSFLAGTSGSCKCCSSAVFALRLTYTGALLTGKFMKIMGFHSRITSEHQQNFGSRLANAGNPLVRQLERHLCRPSADRSYQRVTEHWCSAGHSRLSPMWRPSRRNVWCLSIRLAWLSFSVLVHSCKANARRDMACLPQSWRPSDKMIPASHSGH